MRNVHMCTYTGHRRITYVTASGLELVTVAAAEFASESVTTVESKNAWNSTVLDWRREPADKM